MTFSILSRKTYVSFKTIWLWIKPVRVLALFTWGILADFWRFGQGFEGVCKDFWAIKKPA